MNDRLAEIKRHIECWPMYAEDAKWLIAEVERLKRIEDKYWEQTKVATDAESEVERLKALLDKGHASSDKRRLDDSTFRSPTQQQ